MDESTCIDVVCIEVVVPNDDNISCISDKISCIENVTCISEDCFTATCDINVVDQNNNCQTASCTVIVTGGVCEILCPLENVQCNVPVFIANPVCDCTLCEWSTVSAPECGGIRFFRAADRDGVWAIPTAEGKYTIKFCCLDGVDAGGV